MYTTSTNYKQQIINNSRTFDARITIVNNQKVLTHAEILTFKVEGGIQDQQGFSIGNTSSIKLELTVRGMDTFAFMSKHVLNLEIGLKVNNAFEYVKIGTFNIFKSSQNKVNKTTSITCYDNMYILEQAYFSNLSDNPTMQQIIAEINTKTGVQFDTSVAIPNTTIKRIDGKTYREALGIIASLMGSNVCCNRDGKIKIYDFKDINRDIGKGIFKLTTSDEVFKLGKITVKVDKDTTISKGTLAGDSMELSFENPYMTDSILTGIFNKLNEFMHIGYQMECQGDMAWDLGDILTYTDSKGITYKLPILSYTLDYNGALKMNVSAEVATKSKTEFNQNGSLAQRVQRTVTDLSLINQAFINYAKINDADILSLKSDKAEIEHLKALEGEFQTLHATVASIGDLTVIKAMIDDIKAAHVDVGDLTAALGKINVLQTDIATIETNISKFTSSENSQMLHLTSANVVIDNAVIKSSMIDSIIATKITSGIVNTTNVRIQSESGNFDIHDNTLQIKDNQPTPQVRVQIGKDAHNDYNMYLWNASGQLMFDAEHGVTEHGIANGAVRNDMVANDANISANKLDRNSLFTVLNADGTQTLKSSIIHLDDKNQTLDVAFNSLTTKIDNIKVGARNLLRGTKSFLINQGNDKGFTYAGQATLTHTTDIDGFGVATLSATGNSNEHWSPIVSNELNIKGRGYYTVSFMFKVEDVSKWDTKLVSSLNCYVGSTRHNFDMTPNITVEDNKWYYYTHTIGVDVDNITRSDIAFYLAKNGTISYKKLKFETGTINTDYTEAPEDLDNTIHDLSTNLTAAQGKIQALITDTTIDGSKLKDAFSSLKQTVTGISTDVASHETKINAQTGKIAAVETKASTTEQSLLSVTTRVSSAETNITSLITRVSNAETKITDDAITSKITSVIANNQKGNFYSIYGTTIEAVEHPEFLEVTRNDSTFNTHGFALNIKNGATFPYKIRLKNLFSKNGKYTFKAKFLNVPILEETIEVNINGNTGQSFTKPVQATPIEVKIQTDVQNYDEKNNNGYVEITLNGISSFGFADVMFYDNWQDLSYTMNNHDIVDIVEQKITPEFVKTSFEHIVNQGENSKIETTSFTMNKKGLEIKNGGLTLVKANDEKALIFDDAGDIIINSKDYKGGLFFNCETTQDSHCLIGATPDKNYPGSTSFNFTFNNANEHDSMNFGSFNSAGNGTFYPMIQLTNERLGISKGIIRFNNAASFHSDVYLNSNDLLFQNGRLGQELSTKNIEFNWGKDTNYQSKIWNVEHTDVYHDYKGPIFNIAVPTLFKHDIDIWGSTLRLSGTAKLGTLTNNHGYIAFNTGFDICYWSNDENHFDTLVAMDGSRFVVSSGHTKNAVIETQDFGGRLLYCEEATEVWFNDYGAVIIPAEGIIEIKLDPIFAQTIDLDSKYHIFTQVYNGSITKIKRQYDKFTVWGEPDTEFSYEIKAKRINFAHERLESYDMSSKKSITIK